ncbi:MAG: cupin domain-containing protein [Burkholderiaceae bacterium]
MRNSTKTKMKVANLFQDIPNNLPAELVESLLVSKDVRIERIVSKGHQSPPDFWYDQSENEWVLVVKGEAKLRFETDNEIVHLIAGMHVNIPAHQKHRVDWTRENEETIWLAVFY